MIYVCVHVCAMCDVENEQQKREEGEQYMDDMGEGVTMNDDDRDDF